MMRRLSLVSVALILAPVPSTSAQDRPDIAAQREAMRKLDFWVGEWQGTGWYQAGPGGRRETTVTETIHPKLGGLALLAEGLGRSAGVVAGEETITHDALGIICFDEQLKRYRFVHYRAGDKLDEAELKLIEGGLQWERKVQSGTVRFTAKIQEDRWHEVGEFSADGKTWRPFMEMTLHRVRPTPTGR